MQIPEDDPITKHKFIRLYPNVLTKEECDKVIAFYNASDQKAPGKTGAFVYNPKYKRCVDLGPHPDDPLWMPLDKMISDALHKTVIEYAKAVPRFKSLLEDNRGWYNDSGYLIQYYRPGTSLEDGDDGFEWHTDISTYISCNRFLAMILYLNDVEEGGETEFSVQNIKIKPKGGTMLWFPPTFEYEHRGVTPRSNHKIIATTFLTYPIDKRGPGVHL